MDRKQFEEWFKTTDAYKLLEEMNYFKIDLFIFKEHRSQYQHTTVQIAYMTWQHQQAKVEELQKRVDEITNIATELAEYASYAEIVGGVTVNRSAVRSFCDKVFDFNRKVDQELEQALKGEKE
ncbi:TPA: hypothetical protein ACGAPI_000062 [Acinetobacter baumannii]